MGRNGRSWIQSYTRAWWPSHMILDYDTKVGIPDNAKPQQMVSLLITEYEIGSILGVHYLCFPHHPLVIYCVVKFVFWVTFFDNSRTIASIVWASSAPFAKLRGVLPSHPTNLIIFVGVVGHLRFGLAIWCTCLSIWVVGIEWPDGQNNHCLRAWLHYILVPTQYAMLYRIGTMLIGTML